jgi:predicted RNase H-like HicB family nuclease
VIDLPYSLTIEATEDPTFFGFYSTELRGFTGTGTSVEDCLRKAKEGMAEHMEVLREMGLPVPPPNPEPKILIENSRPWAEVS